MDDSTSIRKDQVRGALTECLVNSATFNSTLCQVKGTISPFFGGSFYWIGSYEWTSSWFVNNVLPPTKLIVINFDKPLYMVQVVAMDADVGPPTMVAFDSVGNQLGSASFEYGPTSPHKGTSGRVIVDNLVRIRRVELRPATNAPDVIFWRDLIFQVPTPPPPISETVLLTPGSAELKAGQMVSYTVTSDKRNPAVVKQWFWQADPTTVPTRGAPMTTVANCGTSTTCTFPLYENGWLWVYGAQGMIGTQILIGGDTYAYNWVLPCLSDTDSDVRLHNPTFRRAMTDVASNLTNLEQGGWPYLDGSDSTYSQRRFANTYVEIPVDTISPCISYWPLESKPLDPVPPASFTRTNIIVHTHPYAKNEIVPTTCGVLPNTKALEGPSQGDYDAFKGFPNVGFVVQKGAPGKPTYLYRFNNPGDKANHSKRWALDSDANGNSSCWIADPKWKS